MSNAPASLWRIDLPPDLDKKLTALFASAPTGVQVFFRADDIGRMDSNFIRMIELFAAYDMPLCAALVPEWLTPDNWEAILGLAGKENNTCWHQHGFSHRNHEQQGKKCEFGPARSRKEIGNDILTGKKRLELLLGERFEPVFTPPWNRCSLETMEVLREQGFIALSRSTGVQPPPPAGLPDLAVNIDLHTRREADPYLAMENLLDQCRSALNSGRMGFMLHHQCMNDNSFLFLERLFKAIRAEDRLLPCTFREILQAG